jgi:hypothetical protein
MRSGNGSCWVPATKNAGPEAGISIVALRKLRPVRVQVAAAIIVDVIARPDVVTADVPEEEMIVRSTPASERQLTEVTVAH